jgi:cell division protein ZapA
MPKVDVTINGRAYQVACKDGEESHLADLAEYFDKRVSELIDTIGPASETRLMLMAGLVIADELSETLDKVETLETAVTDARERGASGSAAVTEKAGRAIDVLAQRLEAIAERLESA